MLPNCVISDQGYHEPKKVENHWSSESNSVNLLFFAFLDIVLNQLNRDSGLLGLTGSADSRDVEESALKGNLKGF